MKKEPHIKSTTEIRPIFDPQSFGLSEAEARLVKLARDVSNDHFAARAPAFDESGKFPSENFSDLATHGLLGACVPESEGGLGANFRTYMMMGAEVGRACGSTALTWNMHVSSTLWTGEIINELRLTPEQLEEHARRRQRHSERIVRDGAVYSQPGSEANKSATGEVLFSTKAKKVEGGWMINGKKIFASLAGNADYYGVLCCEEKENPQLRDTMYIAVPASADGVSVSGAWDTLGMRGTNSLNLHFNDVFVSEEEQLLPTGVYQQAAMRWPHMFLTLSATYIGLAQGAFDFTVGYLRGEIPGAPKGRRESATKQLSVAEMRFQLEQTKALWFQAISEARVDPSKEERLRALAAQHSAMEGANQSCQKAIKTCGGHSLFRSFPLERMYRDSRCGSTMLPWSAERCLEMAGHETLYEFGETD